MHAKKNGKKERCIVPVGPEDPSGHPILLFANGRTFFYIYFFRILDIAQLLGWIEIGELERNKNVQWMTMTDWGGEKGTSLNIGIILCCRPVSDSLCAESWRRRREERYAQRLGQYPFVSRLGG